MNSKSALLRSFLGLATLLGLLSFGGCGAHSGASGQAPANLSYATPAPVYQRGVAIVPDTPSSGGGAATGYQVSPALPPGLRLDPTTGVVSGTPTAVSDQTTYVITASNGDGATTTSLVITVNDAPPTGLQYPTLPAAFTLGQAITPVSPTSNGGTATVYTVNPALPAGLTLNAVTGQLTGTPSALTASATYTVTAWDSGGSTTGALTFAVNDAPPSGLAYAGLPAAFTLGQTITPVSPANAGGAVTHNAVSPALPAGLSLDPTTGLLSGTPTALAASATYTVTASDSGGPTTAGLTFAVLDVPPSSLTYTGLPAAFTLGHAITALRPTSAGGTVTGYAVSPALPAGLTLDAVTGQLTGTPTALTASATYTVTASDSGGTTTAGLTFAVNDVPPTGLTYAGLPAAFTKGTAITALTPASGGGTVTHYAVSPALPAGLTLDAATGRLSGTPTTLTASATYTVTASDSGGSSTAGLTFAVNDVPPAGLTYSANPATYGLNGTITANTPANGGGAVTSYTITPALPPGLALDPDLGILTGTPTALASPAAYTVTATNSGGHTTASLTLEVAGIQTFAGVPSGVGSVDGTGAAARFTFPIAIAVDASGNRYVADQYNHTIRKITGAGVVTTFAGQPGSPGFADGPGSAAQFNMPWGLTVDGANNIWVVDFGNNTIRKITPDGTVSTAAGVAGAFGSTNGNGSSARFNSPRGIATDGTDLYVADTHNHALRKITDPLNTCMVSTLATGFAKPVAVAAGAGSIYVFDSSDQQVYSVSGIGVKSVLAGTHGAAGAADGAATAATFNYAEGLALDAGNNFLYLADNLNNKVRKIDMNQSPMVVSSVTGAPNTLGTVGTADGPAAAAQFNGPFGIALDGSGNLWVADSSNNTVRKLTPGGQVTTEAGLGSTSGSNAGPAQGTLARFNGPQGLAQDADGNLYVADTGNQIICKVTPDGTVSTLAGTPGQAGADEGTPGKFNSPQSVAVDGSGTVYVADTNNHLLRKIAPGGGVSLLAGSGYENLTDGSGALADLILPTALAWDGSGNLLFADDSVIRKVDPSGNVTSIAGDTLGDNSGYQDGKPATSALFNSPQGLVVAGDGTVFIADTYNQVIRKLAPDGTVSTVAGTVGVAGSLDGLTTAARFNQPTGITLDPQGNLYVTDAGSFTLRMITPGGQVSTLAGTAGQGILTQGALPGTLAGLDGILIDASSSSSLFLAVPDALLRVVF